MKLRRYVYLVFVSILLAGFYSAEKTLAFYPEEESNTLTVAEIFNDHMVLQRNARVNVWGTTRSNGTIAIRFVSGEYQASADAEGRWKIQLPPMDAGGPYEMTVTGDGETIQFKDVWIGDVWLASGQSNMAFRFESAKDPEKASLKQNAGKHNLRTYEVAKIVSGGKLLNETNKPWAKVSPDNVDDWSAVAYYFAKGLYEHLNVPIGIINCNQGASRVEAWMSPEALQQTGVELQRFEGDLPGRIRNPSVLYESMLSQVIPYTIKGVIWYQGESNDDNGEAYEKLLSGMIRQWRAEWGQQDLPFLFAQLPGFDKKKDQTNESWAHVRQAQEAVAASMPHTGMVGLLDAGDNHDIHPTNKRTPGERFVLAARAVAYGEKLDYSGPVVDKVRYKGNLAVVTYDHAREGLVVKGDALSGFSVCDKAGVWHPVSADMRKDGRVFIKYSDEIYGVRYGWANAPEVNLFDADGLPAAPFMNMNGKVKPIAVGY